MSEITFNELPKVVSEIYEKLNTIEQLLLHKPSHSIKEADTILNIKQAAEMLNLTVPTIYGLVHESKIPVSKKGRRLYFSKQELMAWIKSGRRKTHEEISVEAEKYLKKKKV
ncbi:MAG: helix-turn-helix domain-containing protein [Saprospiraceae bacterium]|nr:helix-turn-helix domain-containing protein [Saprospiraceae bacterium]